MGRDQNKDTAKPRSQLPYTTMYFLKKGSSPKNTKAGKKCIGIDSPGNISGESKSRAKVIPKGPKILVSA